MTAPTDRRVLALALALLVVALLAIAGSVALVLVRVDDPGPRPVVTTTREATSPPTPTGQTPRPETTTMTTAGPTDERLAAIRTRADAASPGPWHTDPAAAMAYRSSGRCAQVYVEAFAADGFGVIALTGCAEHPHPLTRPNAEFIAHSRDDVAFLLGEVDRLAEEASTAWLSYEALSGHYEDLVAERGDLAAARGYVCERLGVDPADPTPLVELLQRVLTGGESLG